MGKLLGVHSEDGQEAMALLREHVGDATALDDPISIVLEDDHVRIDMGNGTMWVVFNEAATRSVELPPRGHYAKVTLYANGREVDEGLAVRTPE